MNKRKVTIFNSQTGTKEVLESTATTWGELKNSLQSNVSEKTCVLSKSKLNIELDSANLPEEAFTVFVYPKESKGGMAKKKAKKVVKKAAKKPVKKSKAKAAKKVKKTKKVSKPVKKAVGKVVASIAQVKVEPVQSDSSLKSEAEQIRRELGR